MKAGDLLDLLKNVDRDANLYFGVGDLSFYRIKWRGENLVHIDFNQVYSVTVDPEDG